MIKNYIMFLLGALATGLVVTAIDYYHVATARARLFKELNAYESTERYGILEGLYNRTTVLFRDQPDWAVLGLCANHLAHRGKKCNLPLSAVTELLANNWKAVKPQQ